MGQAKGGRGGCIKGLVKRQSLWPEWQQRFGGAVEVMEGRELEMVPWAAGTRSRMKARGGEGCLEEARELERGSTGAVPDGA